MASMTILLVDDDVEVLRALGKVLEKAEYEVVAHSSARSAMEDINHGQLRFDVVITDVCMPEVNGIEFLAFLKQMFPSVPVIMLTAFGDWGQFMDAMKEGAFSYLDKPISKRELLDTVRRALQAAPA